MLLDGVDALSVRFAYALFLATKRDKGSNDQLSDVTLLSGILLLSWSLNVKEGQSKSNSFESFDDLGLLCTSQYVK